MGIRVPDLFAVLGYMADLGQPGGPAHAWRVATLAHKVAVEICPEDALEVFLAGLVHDVGVIGAYKHGTEYKSLAEQKNDPHILSHPRRGSLLVENITGMDKVSTYIATHHELCSGKGYPDGISSESLPMGAQVLATADALDMAGLFVSQAAVVDRVLRSSKANGLVWSEQMWEAVARVALDSDFLRDICLPKSLKERTLSVLDTTSEDSEPDSDTIVERLFHLIAILVDLKDSNSRGHSLRVANMAREVARAMDVSESDSHAIYRAGLVHDCGMLGLSAALLSKTGRYSDEESRQVRKHALLTMDVLNCLPDREELSAIADIAGRDHERFDGSGYPEGLVGTVIPLGSRILAAVDAHDAMLTATNYRLLTPRCAMLRLEQGTGTQFDPDVVAALTSVVKYGEDDSSSKAA